MTSSSKSIPAHNVFELSDGVILSSNFDNGNLASVEKGNKNGEYLIWTAPDNMGSSFQSTHCAWFHFVISIGAKHDVGSTIKFKVMNASNHGGLYKHDMRPVFRSTTANKKWSRVRSPARFQKTSEGCTMQFEYQVEYANDKIYFAFTYPYSYTMVQNDIKLCNKIASQYNYNNDNDNDNDNKFAEIYVQTEVLCKSVDGLNVDLITISSEEGADYSNREALLPGLFPNAGTGNTAINSRPPTFPTKEIFYISCRVHPGEVPAQYTFKGMLDLLLDKTDLRAITLRKRYVFKLIPLLNPDGVYRGHFRMDQFGNNLNRYYTDPNPSQHPSIFATKSLLDYYSNEGKLSAYIDCHAHASKRGCFIYGNVMDNIADQVQNQLYCLLIAMNTSHFDYEGCLFSKEHMTRIDPGDAKKGLTAEGSGRVSTFLRYGLIHSYTIESNYNTSKSGNDVPPCDNNTNSENSINNDVNGYNFTPNPEKYTPSSYASVGRASIIAMLDIRGINPCSRVVKSRHRTIENLRQKVYDMVKNRKEYKSDRIKNRISGLSVASIREKKKNDNSNGIIPWRRSISSEFSEEKPESNNNINNNHNSSSSSGRKKKNAPSKFTLNTIPSINNNTANHTYNAEVNSSKSGIKRGVKRNPIISRGLNYVEDKNPNTNGTIQHNNNDNKLVEQDEKSFSLKRYQKGNPQLDTYQQQLLLQQQQQQQMLLGNKINNEIVNNYNNDNYKNDNTDNNDNCILPSVFPLDVNSNFNSTSGDNNKMIVNTGKDGSSIFIPQNQQHHHHQQQQQNYKDNSIKINNEQSISIQGDAIQVPIPPTDMSHNFHNSKSNGYSKNYNKGTNTRYQRPPNAIGNISSNNSVLHTNINAAIMKSINNHMHHLNNGTNISDNIINGKEQVRLKPMNRDIAVGSNDNSDQLIKPINFQHQQQEQENHQECRLGLIDSTAQEVAASIAAARGDKIRIKAKSVSTNVVDNNFILKQNLSPTKPTGIPLSPNTAGIVRSSGVSQQK